ncbi:synaptotagmin-2-like, partial [Trifolium medium]|nr:synaptotagmin-2-like [Trifolium medium]
MGMNVIPLKELTPNEPKELTLKLLKTLEPDNPENEKPRGELVVEVMYKPFTEDELPKNPEDNNGIEKAPEGTPATGGLLVIIIH